MVDAHARARPMRLQDLLPLQGPADVRDRPSSAVPEQQQQVAAQKRIRTSEGNSAVKKPRLDHAYVVVSGKAQHCEVCRDHWAQRRQAGQTEAWIRGGCNYSKKGCVPCGKRICKQCWATWDHRKKCTSRSEWKQPPQKSIVKKGGRANRP